MKTLHQLLPLALLVAAAQLASAAVPSTINYQGRLTNAAGVPQSGSKAMSLKIYDAATSGTLLYAETVGSVAVDTNGVYGFQFGAAGSSSTLVTETLASTDGTSLTYTKALSNTPVVAGTASVTDGTYSWNETTGNPGSQATATASIVSGFVIGGSVTSGGSGYTSAPVVTITGNGSGATATATVSSGAVTTITITSAGSGYTTGATITIAAPPAPFVVNYTGGSITATYATAPAAGKAITATYRYSAGGISGALVASSEQWLELTVDGIAQSPRQKVLAVPFAQRAGVADVASSLADQSKIWRPQTLVTPGASNGSAIATVTLPMGLYPLSSYGSANMVETVLPATFKKITNVDIDITLGFRDSAGPSTASFTLVRYRVDVGEQVLAYYTQTSSSDSNGRFVSSHPQVITVDQTYIYKLRLNTSAPSFTNVSINDIRLTVTE